MSVLNYIVDKLKTGIITFINAVILANRDYPYFDYHHVDENTVRNYYTVGHNQRAAGSVQTKLFVSKSTLIYCTEATNVRFNDVRMPAVAILALTWYEFKHNIYQVFYDDISAGHDLYLYFEGVLPQEARPSE